MSDARSPGRARRVLGRLVWGTTRVFALALAAAALVLVLDVDATASPARQLLTVADALDLGAFDLTDPVVVLGDGPPPTPATVLVCYGLAAVVWLGLGSVGERLVRGRPVDADVHPSG
ncbi:hypothetical protein [Nocardioides sp.]|uniref:hypothetical protein n=1 Tax=Nocardioides sp. TaxID=35761 RepID=UPI0035141AC7